MKKNSADLTTGSIAPILIKFAIPILVGQLFQNLYNSVDSIIVGNFVGTTALAAVTSSSDVAQMLVSFFTGLSAGAGVLFARFFGAKDHKNLHDSIHTAMLFALILGLSTGLIGVVLSPSLLRLCKCPDNVWVEALQYLRIYFAGIVFTSIYNVGAGVLRAVGDSKDPFIYLVVSSVANIILDLLFVAVFRWGVIGVAVATVLSQALSTVLVIRNMLKTDDVYKLIPGDLRIRKNLLMEIMNLGLPAGLQTSLTAISNLFIMRYINMLGAASMAGFGASKKLDKFCSIFAASIGLACTTFISQNIGAKKPERAFKGIRVCLLICLVCVAALGTIIYFNAETILHWFTPDKEAVEYGVLMTKVMMPLYSLQALNQIFPNAVRGFGRSRTVMVLSITGLIGMRQLFLQTMMRIDFNVKWVYFSYPFGWFCASFLVIMYYLIFVRPKFAHMEPSAEQ